MRLRMAVAQLQRRCCCCCCCCCYCCCCCCCAATCDGEAGAAPLSGARGSDFQGSDVRRAFLRTCAPQWAPIDQQYMSSRECPMATNAEHVIRVLKVSMS